MNELTYGPCEVFYNLLTINMKQHVEASEKTVHTLLTVYMLNRSSIMMAVVEPTETCFPGNLIKKKKKKEN